jgi:site-specific recombinase XerD
VANAKTAEAAVGEETAGGAQRGGSGEHTALGAHGTIPDMPDRDPWPSPTRAGYSCGLRLLEGVRLHPGDIDGGRHLLLVRKGKGNKDRYVPLPDRMVELLRNYWRSHRDPEWMFPSHWKRKVLESVPMDPSGLQKVFRDALSASGIEKAASIHTLRHSYATHLLEAGVSLRVIQAYLGHNSPATTAIYAHLTQPMEEKVLETVSATLESVWG